MQKLITKVVVTAVILLTAWVALGAAIFWTLKPTGKPLADAKTAKRLPPIPLFQGWPTPQAVIVISGQQLGFMEPCGCVVGQMGGLTRRHTFLRDLRKRGWPVALVDLGGLVRDRSRQDEIKFESSLKILQDDFDYAAVGVGPQDLALGSSLALMQWMVNKPKLPLVNANVALDADGAEPLTSVVVPLAGLRLGITSVIAGTSADQAKQEGSNVQPAEDVLPEIVAKLKADSDVRLLLSQASPAESKQLAEKFPDFDIVVTAGGPEDPDNRPVWVGNTMIVATGMKGKYVCVVGLFPGEKGKDRLRLELVALNQDFPPSPDIEQAFALYQDILKQNNLVEQMPRVASPDGATFVGSAACGECHTAAYKKWGEAKHSKAWQSIVEKNRQFDPECVFCHTTGNNPETHVTYQTGFVTAQQTPHLVANGCENCHGPGSLHVAEEQDTTRAPNQAKKYLAMVRRSAKDAKASHLCEKCHDQDNSPNFDFDTYWPKIVHPGRD